MSAEQNAPGLEPKIEDLDATPDDAEGVIGGIGEEPTAGQFNPQGKAKTADKAYNKMNQYINE